jgi:hypothetical protein
MSYQTGSYVDANDLLDKTRLKGIAEGWTVNKYEAIGLGDRLHMNKGTVYMNFRSTINDTEFTNGVGNRYGIASYLGTGYDGGQDWDRQPGYTEDVFVLVGGFLYTNNGIGEFHIFTLPDTLCIYCDSPLYKEQMIFGQTSLGFPIMSVSEVILEDRGASQFRYFLSSITPGIAFSSLGVNQIIYDSIKEPQNHAVAPIITCIGKDDDSFFDIRPICTDLLINSVNQLRGNSLLIETHMFYSDTFNNLPNKDTEYLGVIEGLFVVTLSGIESYQTITYGAEEYITSYLYPDDLSPYNTFGVAALKN